MIGSTRRRLSVTSGGSALERVWLAGSEPTYGDVYFTEHVDAFTSVDKRNVLRCRHDNGTYIPRVNMTLRGYGRGRETLPSTITNCPRLSWTSPVPGGMSMTRTSRSPAWSRQSTSNSSCGILCRYSAENMGLGDGITYLLNGFHHHQSAPDDRVIVVRAWSCSGSAIKATGLWSTHAADTQSTWS